MENLRRLGEMFGDKELKWRKDVFNIMIGDLTIDTCYAPDVRKWETGIEKDGKWTIVEEYPDRENAVIGHAKWVKLIKENSNTELKGCRDSMEWFFGDD